MAAVHEHQVAHGGCGVWCHCVLQELRDEWMLCCPSEVALLLSKKSFIWHLAVHVVFDMQTSRVFLI